MSIKVGLISRKVLKVIRVKLGKVVCLYPKNKVYSRNILRRRMSH